MSVTPHVRELRAKAVTYGRVIANWGTYAPTMPQLQAKRGEVSGVSKKPGAMREPNVASSFPPDGVAWNANVNAGSTRPRSKMPERATTPPPPRPTTIPPVSAPRSIDTPTPALLRSRRSR
jgi:hypothetical protein